MLTDVRFAMQYDEFLDRVLERTAADTREDARRAVEATLSTLGERLDRTERRKLAAQLPNELQAILEHPHDGSDRQRHERFMLEEFYKRVAGRLDLRYGRAEETAKAVTSVLQEAVSEGEIEDVLSSMSSEYRQLF